MKLLVSLLMFTNYAFAAQFLPESFKADITQSYKSVVSGKVKETPVEMSYRYPGHLRFEVKGNNPSLFVTNRTTSWYYTPPIMKGEKGEVIVQPPQKLVFSQFFDTLKKGLGSNKLYTVKPVSGETVKVDFSGQTQKELRIASAIFVPKSGKIKTLDDVAKIHLNYTDGKEIDLIFNDLKKDVSFGAQDFNFSIPENTNVVKN